MRLFEPLLYNAIRTNKERVCGIRSRYDQQEDPNQEIEKFLKIVSEKRRSHARDALIRLFPRFENVGYSHSFIESWEAQRRVCTDKHFDTYFRMGVGDETLPVEEIEDFIKHAGEIEYVKDAFRQALCSIRKNGKSKVPLLFDEINVHASKIDKANFQPLISAIFQIADDIHRDDDRERGGFSIGDNHLRIHWLIRKLNFDRCNIEERSAIFLEACKNAQVGWLVDFTSSAIDDHFPREGKQPETSEKFLIGKKHISALKAHALKIIRSAADTGELTFHPQLPFILFRWREFCEDDGFEVKKWTGNQLKIDESVSLFARAFTGESWSQGMGMFGMGDRVAMRNVRASVNGLEQLLDVDQFRQRLEEIEKKEPLNQELKENVLIFLETWRNQEKGENRHGHE
jgi:predicted KAP-like P-loop ATPase